MAERAPLPAGWDCHVHVFDGPLPAAPAHYRPVQRPLAQIEALAAASGLGRLVLVQPSVYGSDNTLLLQALRQAGGRHRGVVVLRGDEDDSALAALHAAGVRGVRFNLVSPVGSERAEALRLLRDFAPALARRGWHVQWYVAPLELPYLAQWQRECGLPFVLDHLAGLTPASDDAPTWAALEQLARAGCWIKLSGWYRLQAPPPYGALHGQLRRVAQVFGERMVWGSDWPHTSFTPQEAPVYESLWLPVVRTLGEDAALHVRLAGARLYA
jgi:predicted TIM-barrel fold metal-dependent hydrolase